MLHPAVPALLRLLLGPSSLALALAGCVADESLPIGDLCVAQSSGKEDPKVCVACTSDADCDIGGNPCCDAQLRWTCGHVDALAKLEACEDNTCSKPPVPAQNRCRCVEGRCHAR